MTNLLTECELCGNVLVKSKALYEYDDFFGYVKVIYFCEKCFEEIKKRRKRNEKNS